MQSLQSKAKTAIWGFYVLAAGALAGAVGQSFLVGFIKKLQTGDTDGLENADGIDVLLGLGGGLYLIGLVVSGIAFLAWFFAAHKNLRQAGLLPEYASGWAIGGFFVPFLNLLRPYQVMRELWKGSEYLVDASDDGDWQEREAGPLVGQWWALFIVAGIAGRIASRIGMGSDQLSDLLAESYAVLVSDLIDVAAVLVAALLVKKITGFQDQARRQWDVHEVKPGEVPEFGSLGAA